MVASTNIEQEYQHIFGEIFGKEPNLIEKLFLTSEEELTLDLRAICIICSTDLREMIPSLSHLIIPKNIKNFLNPILRQFDETPYFSPLYFYLPFDENFTDSVAILSRALTQGYRYLRQTGQLEDEKQLYTYTRFIGEAIKLLEELAQKNGEGNELEVKWGATKGSPGSVFFTYRVCIAIHNILRARIVDLQKKDELETLLFGVSNWLSTIIDDAKGSVTEEGMNFFPKAASGYALQAASEIFMAFEGSLKNRRLIEKCRRAFDCLSEPKEWLESPIDWLANCPDDIKAKALSIKDRKDIYRSDDSGVYSIISGISSWMTLEPSRYYTPDKLSILKDAFNRHIIEGEKPQNPYAMERLMRAFGLCLPVIMSEEVRINKLSLRAGLGNFLKPLKASDSLAEELFELLLNRFS